MYVWLLKYLLKSFWDFICPLSRRLSPIWSIPLNWGSVEELLALTSSCWCFAVCPFIGGRKLPTHSARNGRDELEDVAAGFLREGRYRSITGNHIAEIDAAE